MKAVILTGGKGGRLMPLTQNIRKAYLSLGSKRVIDHIIDRLPKGTDYSISENDIGAAAAVAESLEGSEPVMVVCGDNYFSENFDGFIKAFTGKPLVGIYDIGAREMAKNYGVVELDSKGKIAWFIEKPKKPKDSLVSTGIYIFPPGVFHLVRHFAELNPKKNLGDLIKHLVVNTPAVYSYLFAGVWLDIGTPESYQKAQSIV